MRRTSISIVLSLLLVGLLSTTLNVREVKASGTIYIRVDGSIDPPAAPILSADNITYALAESMYASIVIERNNIVVDGNGYTLQGAGEGNGLYWSGVNNVTIRNTTISSFGAGIWFSSSSNNSISQNNIVGNYYGIGISSAPNTSITGNHITDNWEGIRLSSASDCTSISGNSIAGNDFGIYIISSSNSVTQNNITANNYEGILLDSSTNNSITGNRLTNNQEGIGLSSSTHNSISQNNITNNGAGIGLDLSSNNSIIANHITANSAGGIYLLSSSNNSISQNSMTANYEGLLLYGGSSDNGIQGNNITANNWYGVNLVSSSNNSISGNHIADNGYGVRLYDGSSYNSIQGNHVTANNWYGLYLYRSSNTNVSGTTFTRDGLYVEDSYQNSFEDNSVNGRPLVYLEGASNYTVDNAGQVILVRCDNITVAGLNLSRAAVGIELWQTADSTISGNHISANNVDGIVLSSSFRNSITGNNITANSYYGIWLESSAGDNSISGNNIVNNHDGIRIENSYHYDNIFGNNLTNNYYGIRLSSVLDHRIFHNNLINNTQQVYSSSSINIWDDGYPSGGNYWSDYTGEDTRCGQHQTLPWSDGLGDTPYIINGLNQDNYPITEPWSWAPNDIAVKAVALPRNVVGQGYNLPTNVTVTNQGVYAETFNVTICANTTLLETREVVLSSGNSTTLTFTWNTSSVALGNYTIRACAAPVPGETNTVDNTFIYGWVTVTIPGDVNGDGDVDIFDIVRMAGAYGTEPPDPKYDPHCDIDEDLDIDIFDIVIAAGHYGQSW